MGPASWLVAHKGQYRGRMADRCRGNLRNAIQHGRSPADRGLALRADNMMYERKRQRAAAREAASSGDIGDDIAIDHSVTGVMAAYASKRSALIRGTWLPPEIP